MNKKGHAEKQNLFRTCVLTKTDGSSTLNKDTTKDE